MSETINAGNDDFRGFTHRWSKPANEIFGALAKAQAGIKNAVRENTNPHFKSRYADLASVKEACWEHLTGAGIAVVQMPVNDGASVGVVTLFAHSSGQWIEGTVYAQPTKFDAQGVGSVITYLRRYSLAAMAGVAPDDDDGEAAVGRPEARRTQAEVMSGNGARNVPRRQEAAPPPSDEKAEIMKRFREIRADIDREEDPKVLRTLDEWPAFNTLDRLYRESAGKEEADAGMQMLLTRARKRVEQLVGSLEPLDR